MSKLSQETIKKLTKPESRTEIGKRAVGKKRIQQKRFKLEIR